MNQKGISSIVIILIIVGVLIIAGGVWYWQSQKGKPVACTQDAKLCLDGSYVSRTGLNCEFTACPEAKDETADWKTYQNDQYGFLVKYPPTLKVWENQQSGKAVYGVSFENPLANQTTAGRKIVFSISVFNNSSQMEEEYKSLGLEDKGEIIIDGHSAKKFFRPLSSNNTLTETTVYLIADKSISIHFQGTSFHKITESDISQILSSFGFTK